MIIEIYMPNMMITLKNRKFNLFILNTDKYDEEKDKDLVSENIDDVREQAKHSMFNKGQSKRIWNELFKVDNLIFLSFVKKVFSKFCNHEADLLTVISHGFVQHDLAVG